MSVPRTDADIEFSDYGTILRRRWRLVVLGLVVGVMGAAAAIFLIPKTYTSTASVMVQETGEDGSVQGGRTSTPINLDTEAQIVKSTVVSQKVIDALDDPISTEPRELAKHVMVTVPPNTSVLNIAFSAPTPGEAQAGAAQYAESYLANRKAVAEGRLESEARSLQAQIQELQTTLRSQTQRIARLPDGSDEREYQISQRDLIVDQIGTLNSQLLQFTSTEVLPGDVITDAQKPITPSDPNIKILGASGLLAGLLLGLLLAVLVDRADKRVRDRRDLERLGLETLVAKVDVPAPRDVPSTPGGGRGVESLRQLRNALLARISPGRGLVLVAGVSKGDAGSAVAINLAATLARSGVNALLVSANSAHCAVTEAFDAWHRRGLADVLRGNADFEDVVFDAPHLSGLRVMTAGSDGSLYSELLQSSQVKSLFDEIAATVDVVVVDVAPSIVNADAQSLAAGGAGVLLVAAELETNRAEVVDAIDQFQHVSAVMLGAVVASVQPQRAPMAEDTQDEPHQNVADEHEFDLSSDDSSLEPETSPLDSASSAFEPPQTLESTLIDMPAISPDDLAEIHPEPHAAAHDGGQTESEIVDDAAAQLPDGSEDDLDDDEEQRPVYLREHDVRSAARGSRFSLTRAGSAVRARRDD